MRPLGGQLFDQSLGQAYASGEISAEAADLYASNKARMTRYIDDINKRLRSSRGEACRPEIGSRCPDCISPSSHLRQMITTLETGARLDLFEPDDLTALVCHVSLRFADSSSSNSVNSGTRFTPASIPTTSC
jgi:hypothetical protein